MPETLPVARPPQLQLGSLADPAELGRMLAASHYFEDVKEAAQAVVKVLAGAELGIPPIASMTGVYIVKGRVTLSANLISALIKRHPRYDFQVADLTNDGAVLVFLDRAGECGPCVGSGRVEAERGTFRRCPDCVGTGALPLGRSSFTIEDARAAGLAGADNWRHYPRNMLYARAVSNGAKWFVPDVFAGAPIYTPDELGAEIDPESGELAALPPRAEVLDPEPPRPRPEPEPEPQGEPEPEPPETPPAPPGPPPGPRPAVSDPSPAGADQGAESAVQTAVEDGPINNAEFAKLLELLDRLQAPESFRRMAAMKFGVEDLAQLTRSQALEIATNAENRFGS